MDTAGRRAASPGASVGHGRDGGCRAAIRAVGATHGTGAGGASPCACRAAARLHLICLKDPPLPYRLSGGLAGTGQHTRQRPPSDGHLLRRGHLLEKARGVDQDTGRGAASGVASHVHVLPRDGTAGPPAHQRRGSAAGVYGDARGTIAVDGTRAYLLDVTRRARRGGAARDVEALWVAHRRAWKAGPVIRAAGTQRDALLPVLTTMLQTFHQR